PKASARWRFRSADGPASGPRHHPNRAARVARNGTERRRHRTELDGLGSVAVNRRDWTWTMRQDAPDHRRTYTDGRPYRAARGRFAPRQRISDVTAFTRWVVDLDREQPTAAEFMARIQTELKIRFYQPRSRKSYKHAVNGFLAWF